MTYTEGNNSISMENAIPMTDEKGKTLVGGDQVFDFTVSMNIIGKFKIAYEVVAEKLEETSTLGNQEVRLYLERSLDAANYTSVMEPTYYVPSKKATSFGAPIGSMIMDTGTVTETTVYYYRLRMWVDEEYKATDVAKSFTVRVNVYGTTEERTLDEEGPRCEFGEYEEKQVGEESKLLMTCIDEEMGVEKKELQPTDFTISDPTIGEIKAITSPTRITNGYQYELTLLGKARGSYTLTLPEGIIQDKVGNGNQAVSKELLVKGLPEQSIEDLDITVEVDSIVYDGTEKKPTVVVKHGDVVLTEGVDYTIDYGNNTNAGEGTITITGTGNINETTGVGYTGTETKTFTIEKAEPVVTLSATKGTVGINGRTFTEKASVAGTFTHESSDTSIATVSPPNYDSVEENISKEVKVTAVSNNATTITITFTPTDVINYKSVSKTYTATADTISPVISLNSIKTSSESTNVTLADEIEIRVLATDNLKRAETLNSICPTCTKDGNNGEFKILVNGEEIQPIRMVTNPYRSGYKDEVGDWNYEKEFVITFDLDGITKTGDIVLIISEGLVRDLAYNTNIQTSISTGIKVVGVPTEKFALAYTYNETENASNYCVTGLEETCQKTTCYRNKVAGSCPVGTIVRYKVNNSKVVTFHVMEDKGTTMTMQSQKNLKYDQKYQTQWISKEDYVAAGGSESMYSQYSYTWITDNGSEKGPLTALRNIEFETADWTNVNNQTYAMGTTVFKDNAYTACNLDTLLCSTNQYTLPSRTAKVRLITFQEAKNFGCKYGSGTCPKWMSNYLSTASFGGGTINDRNNVRYSTMSVIGQKKGTTEDGTVLLSYYLPIITQGGIFYEAIKIDTGVRPVVIVSK